MLVSLSISLENSWSALKFSNCYPSRLLKANLKIFILLELQMDLSDLITDFNFSIMEFCSLSIACFSNKYSFKREAAIMPIIALNIK